MKSENESIAVVPHLKMPGSTRSRRCLQALGYKEWHPPVEPSELPLVAAPEPDTSHTQAPNLAVRLARAALRVRRTLVGRLLYRLTPKPVLAALKSHLS